MATAEAGKNGMVRAPEGFRRIGSVTDAPWFFMKKGNLLYGKLLNVYSRPDDRVPKNKDGSGGTSKFFQIEILEGCEVKEGVGEAAKVVKAAPGTVVNLNYTVKTKVIEEFVPEVIRGAEVHVWAPVGNKKPLKGGKSMWDIEPHINIVTPAPAANDEVEFTQPSA